MSKRNRGSRRKISRAIIEAMEQRQHLSGTVNVAVASGVMTITGDVSANAIVVEDTGVGTFNITGKEGTSVRYNGVTTVADTPVGITLATGNVIMDFSQGGADTITAANDLDLSDATGAHYNLTFTGTGAGAKSLFRAISATGMVAFTDTTTAVAEVQTLTPSGSATSGTWTITYDGNTTAPLNYNDNVATIEAAVQLLAGCSNVVVSGSALDGGGGMVFTWADTDGNAKLLTVDVSGTDVTATVVQTTRGEAVGAVPMGLVQIADNNSAAAEGTLSIIGTNLVAGDRFTLNDGNGHIKTLQAVAAGASGLQFNIGGTKALTMANIVNKINALQAANAIDITATDNGDGTASLVNDASGIAGNQPIVVSAFSASRLSSTGMSGGGATNVSAGNTVTIDDGVNPAKVFTFGGGAGQVAIGASAIVTAGNLATAINAAEDLNVMAFDNGDGSVTLVANGAGDAYHVTKVGGQITATDFSGGSNGTSVFDGDTITLDDGVSAPITFTAVDAAPGTNEFAVGADSVSTMANFVAAVNAANAAGDLLMTALDNGDGTCTLTAAVAGTIGNQTIGTSGDNIFAADMAGGIGGSLAVQDFSVTMGTAGSYVGLGAAYGTEAQVFGNVSVTGGAGDDTVEIVGATIYGNTTITLAAAASGAGDSLTIADNGQIATLIGGTLGVTQTDGLSTLSLSSAASLAPLTLGGAVTINVGANAAGTAVTTLDHVLVDAAFSYTGGAGDDTLELNNGVTISNHSVVNLAAGTNTFTVDGAFSGGYSGTTTVVAGVSTVQPALAYTGGAGADTVSMSAAAVSEVQTLTSSATAASGTWTLTYNGVTTIPMAFNATLAQIQNTVRGLAGCENVVVSGSRLNQAGSMVFTFGAEDGDALALSADLSSIGGTPTATWVETTKGALAGSVTTLGALTFTMGDGANALTLDNTLLDGALTYTGGLNADTVAVGSVSHESTGAMTINAGDGANSFTLDNGTLLAALSYTGTAGADTVNIGQNGTFYSRAAVTINSGAGANGVTLDGRSRGVTYTGGAGADTLTIGGKVGSGGYRVAGDVTFTGNAGADQLSFDGSLTNLTFTGGAGADTIILGSDATEHVLNARGNVAITAGGGANALTAKYTTVQGTFNYTGLEGVDTINIGQGGGGVTGLKAYKAATINTGAGNDIVNIDASIFNLYSGATSIDLGLGDDTLRFDVNAASGTHFMRALTVAAGGGSDVLTDRTVVGAAGTFYDGPTSLLKASFTGVRNGTTTLNGSTTGTVNGRKRITPTYA